MCPLLCLIDSSIEPQDTSHNVSFPGTFTCCLMHCSWEADWPCPQPDACLFACSTIRRCRTGLAFHKKETLTGILMCEIDSYCVVLQAELWPSALRDMIGCVKISSSTQTKRGSPLRHQQLKWEWEFLRIVFCLLQYKRKSIKIYGFMVISLCRRRQKLKPSHFSKTLYCSSLDPLKSDI